MSVMSFGSAYSPDDLGRALRDALNAVEPLAPPTAFALVPTATLAQVKPELVGPDDDSALSVLIEEPLPVTDETEPHACVEEFLATAHWPGSVAGAALVLTIVVVPPHAGTPDTPAQHPGTFATAAGANAHPDARPARLAVGALRVGHRLALLELADDDGATDLRTHPELAADLQVAIATALED